MRATPDMLGGQVECCDQFDQAPLPSYHVNGQVRGQPVLSSVAKVLSLEVSQEEDSGFRAWTILPETPI